MAWLKSLFSSTMSDDRTEQPKEEESVSLAF
jgi:hypothetical protein